jgi:hypothetical protein
MSRSEPDATRIVRLWLEEGVTALPDHVLDTVLDQLPATSQRRSSWLARRTPTMNKFVTIGLAAAAVVVAVFIGSQLLGAPNVIAPPSDPTPSPSASAPPTPRPLGGSDLGPPGTILRAATFSEPFTFTMPSFPDVGAPIRARVDGDGHGLNLGSIETWGHVSFDDDRSLPALICRPTGPKTRIPDVPATPDEVGQWLESSADLEFLPDQPVELTVDGRTALRWDVATPMGVCDPTEDEAGPWFGEGERHRVYAIPTGGDTILVITYGANWSLGTEEYLDAINAATDDLVQSMEFGN